MKNLSFNLYVKLAFTPKPLAADAWGMFDVKDGVCRSPTPISLVQAQCVCKF